MWSTYTTEYYSGINKNKIVPSAATWIHLEIIMGFPSGLDGKESGSNEKTQVRYQGWDNPLEKGMATHSSILAWEISWTEEPGGLQSMRSERVGHD